MKVVILAGGRGTRIGAELIPKPMIEIGGKPIIHHIMDLYKHYDCYGCSEFIICLGYMGQMIREYFLGIPELFPRLTLVATGWNTNTGGRLKKIREFVKDDTFLLTYGDGLCNVNINDLIQFHLEHKKVATVTAVQPAGRYGALQIDERGHVNHFSEKPPKDGVWINGGFFVLQPEVFNYITEDDPIWERGPLENLAIDGQLMAYKHNGFWRGMDTNQDRADLENIWASREVPWKV
jgi:glucose-1-phosphate cytidylyltransferase